MPQSPLATVAAHASAELELMLPGLIGLWAETTGHPEIIVAVVDGMVDTSHDSFSKASLSSVDTVAVDEAPSGNSFEHGTHVASLIFGKHTVHHSGIAPACTGIIAPVYGCNPDGSTRGSSQLDLARAIEQAVSAGARVINLSGGQLSSSPEPERPLADAIRLCADRNVALISAAGNDGCACLHVPAAHRTVLVVGAIDRRGEPLEFSNWSPEYVAHGVLAPGQEILGAVPGGGFARRTGTSYAAPFVSGVVALLLSYQLAHGVEPNPREVFNAILNGATDLDASPLRDRRRLLRGKLDIAGALRAIKVKGRESVTEPTTMMNGIDAPLGLHLGAQAIPAGTTPALEPRGQDGPMVSRTPSSTVMPSDCGCGGSAKAENSCACAGKKPTQLAYVLGQISFDFGSEARRDSLSQHAGRPLLDATAVLDYLQSNPWDAASVIWTLAIDATPIYAIQPYGPFAQEVYAWLRRFLAEQDSGSVERVSVPGVTSGKVTLLSGQVVPILWPEIRGLSNWSTKALVEAVKKVSSETTPEMSETVSARVAAGLTGFLDRVYYELRSLGLTPEERAINFAATNAFQAQSVFARAISDGLELETIGVERSPICRPGSDCWDVKLFFFDPARRLERARRVYRFTIDVSDVVPVTVGEVRSWSVY